MRSRPPWWATALAVVALCWGVFLLVLIIPMLWVFFFSGSSFAIFGVIAAVFLAVAGVPTTTSAWRWLRRPEVRRLVWALLPAAISMGLAVALVVQVFTSAR